MTKKNKLKLLSCLSLVGVVAITTPFIYACANNSPTKDPLEKNDGSSKKDESSQQKDPNHNTPISTTPIQEEKPINQNKIIDDLSEDFTIEEDQKSQTLTFSVDVLDLNSTSSTISFNLSQPIQNAKIEAKLIEIDDEDNELKRLDTFSFTNISTQQEQSEIPQFFPKNELKLLFNNLKQDANYKLKVLKINDKYVDLQKSHQIEFRTDDMFEVSFANLSLEFKQQTYPSQITKEQLQPQISPILANDYTIVVNEIDPLVDAKGVDISNWLGGLAVNVSINHKTDSSKNIVKTVYVDGFKRNPTAVDPVANPQLSPQDELQRNYFNFVKFKRKKQFKLENDQYISSLASHLQRMNGLKPYEYRQEITTSKNKRKEYDKKAKAIGLDSYDNSYVKGFTLPVYDKNDSFIGLSFNDREEIGKAPSLVDAVGRNQWRFSGLPRSLVNEHYKRIAQQSYSIEFNTEGRVDRESQSESGTMWILDFEKTTDNSYPTKWYFGTNLHVADGFVKDKMKNFIIRKLAKDADTSKTLTPISGGKDFESFYFLRKLVDLDMLKVVFSGADFLNTNPGDYLTQDLKDKYPNLQEFIDFAVIEIDFSKLQANNDSFSGTTIGDNGLGIDLQTKYQQEFNDPKKFAEMITFGYANESNKENHIKFKSDTYLNNYKQIDAPILSQKSKDQPYSGDDLYILGFPSSQGDFYLNDPEYATSEEKELYSRREELFSIWVNSEPIYYKTWNDPSKKENKAQYSDEVLNKGNYLSNSLGYRTFVEMPGVLDSFISATHTGKSLFKYQEQPLIAWCCLFN